MILFAETQLPDGLIAQLVQHCSSANAEAMGSNPIEAVTFWINISIWATAHLPFT